MKNKVVVLGAGSWGTALSLVLAGNGYAVTLWVRRDEYCEEMEKNRENTLYLRTFPLPPTVTLTSDIAEAVKNAEVVICAVPSHAVRSTISLIKEKLTENVLKNILWISVAKGIEANTHLTMSSVISNVLGFTSGAKIAALSGPSFAEEVAMKKPTAVVAASSNVKTARKIQELLSCPSFRVYTHHDIIGVEVGGSVKNVIAIAVGICDGLELGANARSALITRGLCEIIRLGSCMGADASTFSGLSGLGDLVLTCTGSLSRNRSVGFRIGQGEKLNDVLRSMVMVAEGVKNTLSVFELGNIYAIDMPITKAVYEILFLDKKPIEVAEKLMNRVLKEEMDGNIDRRKN